MLFSIGIRRVKQRFNRRGAKHRRQREKRAFGEATRRTVIPRRTVIHVSTQCRRMSTHAAALR
jgi:hypothetical protein